MPCSPTTPALFGFAVQGKHCRLIHSCRSICCNLLQRSTCVWYLLLHHRACREALCAALSLAGPHRRLLLASGKPEDQAEQLSHSLVAQVLDSRFTVHGQPPPSERQQVEQLLRAQALSLRCCAYSGCTNLAGPSEASLQSKRCAGCRVARYCGPACQTADWRSGGHKAVCGRLRAAVAAD